MVSGIYKAVAFGWTEKDKVLSFSNSLLLFLAEGILCSSLTVRGFLQTFPPHCLEDSCLKGKLLVRSDDHSGSFQPYPLCGSVFPIASLNKI